MKERNKKLLLSLLVLVLLVSIGKETYALFTNEVSSIVQSYGTGTLKLSYSNTNINLDNAYPMTDTDGMRQSDSTITITNIGTLAYKFNVILDPSSDSTISSDLIRVSMDGEKPATLSTDSNIIIRDVILNPGSSRTFTIKLWINSNTSSSDILNKKFSASLTSTGIAVKNMADSNGTVLIGGYTGPLYDYIKDNANTTTQIDFSKTSEQSNTNGIYMTTNTEGNVPVYYYRGAVDNNVLFANYCWKIIRTTETGGVKLIYDGVPNDIFEGENIDQSSYTNVENDATYPYTFDSTNKTWTSTNKTDSTTGTITFIIAEAGDYILSYTMSSEDHCDKALFYKNGTKLEEHSGTEMGIITLTGLTTTDIIKVEYTKNKYVSEGSDTVTFGIGKAIGSTTIKVCNNTSEKSTIGTAAFNLRDNSPAHAGYMYNTAYETYYKDLRKLTGPLIFGNDIDYDASTNQYTLKDTYALTDPSNWEREYETIASKYHYTCLTADNTCTSVYYAHSIGYTYIYPFTLTNGKNHLDILEEMLNSDNINTKDSTMKTKLDTWYKNNMTSYTPQLEDTVFCNDRGYDVSKSGWNKDYSADDNYLYFNSYSRLSSYKPSLVCSRRIDKFTVEVSNGNGALTYPVGLITTDEVSYAGGRYRSSNYSYYLYNGDEQWTFSPYYFYDSSAYGYILSSSGYLDTIFIVAGNLGVRPVVSLKPGIAITGGSGTTTDPFVIK